jgi:RNA polymerase sigma factor (sigma-70 family)
MSKAPLLDILGHIRSLVGAGGDADRGDRELLRRFAAGRDEAAFAALLARHGPLVLGVCRQVLRDPHDAEDAFQAAFLVLARKADSIRRQESLPAWLYRVALNIARTAKSGAARRRVCERQAAAMSSVSSAEAAAGEWPPLLHEEVDRLPRNYRVPVVLCYLEGRTNESAARELGWPVGTVKGRLARARALLRTRLARRGLALSAGGVAALLTQSAVRAAVPAALARSTLQAALQFAAGKAASAACASAATVRLASGALRTPALNKLVVAAFFVSAAAAVAAGGGLLAPRTPAAPPGDRPAAEAGEQPGSAPAPRGNPADPPVRERIVFVGDSSTDGNTYLMLVRQGLARAGRPVPACINAGVSMDTAHGVRQRLERDVFPHRPTLVVFSAGIEDAIVDVAPADYEADVRAMADQVRAEGVPLLLLTTGVPGPGLAKVEPRLAEYNAILHRLAGEFGCRLADVNRRMREARDAGLVVVEADNVNPNFEGQRLIARAVLDALDYSDVPAPTELSVGALPGVLKEWRVRVAPGGQPGLDERTVAALDPDAAGWTTYALPEKGPARTWWLEQERKRGFALSLDKLVGPAKLYQGAAYLQADGPKVAFLHTGAHLQSVWLNGQCVYRGSGWTGWHAGKECVPVQLLAERNLFVIETGADFFLSVTDDAETPEEGPPP